MLPLKDELSTRRFPVINYILIALNILAFIYQYSLGPRINALVEQYALIPAQVTSGLSLDDFVRMLTSMFMHGSIAHIGGNLLYLWIFGDNVEDAMGSGRYLLFYLMGGFCASAAHILTNPYSQVPTVGASGAIAAVLGAYLVLYPQSRVLTLITFGIFIRLTMVPAVLVLGLWFVYQLILGLLTIGSADMGGVAFWAHIGGFVIGMVGAKIFSRRVRHPDYRQRRTF